MSPTRRHQQAGPTPPKGCTDEWFTRACDFAPLHREFNFTLDACATKESAKLPRFFTPEQNGLVYSWVAERVWCNPPYSPGNLERWVAKCAQEAAAGAELVVALLPRRTDVRWWHSHIEPGRLRGSVEVRFLRGRLRFGWPGMPDGHPRCSGRFPNALVIWRRKEVEQATLPLRLVTGAGR